MIFFDVTKASAGGHRSGLMRVSARLQGELAGTVSPVSWNGWDRMAGPSDWFFTAELFSESARPGFAEFLRRHPCRSAAIFYDAIPLKYPLITWPQSVARHPGYMKLLAQFDRVWAISEASRTELLGFWRWQGIEAPPLVDVLTLGADFNGQPRQVSPRAAPAIGSRPFLLSVGILEPRKNQAFLMDVCEDLWAEGALFDLHIVGRVNPHFGRPILEKLRRLRRRGRPIHYRAAADDSELSRLYLSARASVFPTIAEGCGLPLLESLWMGVPCVCSALPALDENAAGGGCLSVPLNDRLAWKTALGRVLSDAELHRRLSEEARLRALPTWAEAARTLQGVLASASRVS